MALSRRQVALGAPLAAAGLGLSAVARSQTARGAGPDSLQLGQDAQRRLTTEVLIDGRGPFVFIVDTGANRTAVAEDVAATLALPSGPTLRVNDVAGAYDTPSARLDKLTIGTLSAGPFLAPVLPRRGLGADGLVGIDAFQGRRVTLDFVADRLRLEETGGKRRRTRDAPAPSGRSQVRLAARQRPGGLLTFEARVGQTRVVCFVDSGAPVSVGHPALLETVRRIDVAPAFQSSATLVRSATGQTVPAILARVPSLRLGSLTVTDLDIPFADLHAFRTWGLDGGPALLLGIDFLRVFDLIELDYAASTVLFRFSDDAGPRRRARNLRP